MSEVPLASGDFGRGDFWQDAEEIPLALEAYLEGVRLAPSYEVDTFNVNHVFLYFGWMLCYGKDISRLKWQILHLRYRGTPLIRNRPHPRTTMRP